MTRMKWTPANDAQLTRMWADGMHSRDIGEALGGGTDEAVRRRAAKIGLPRRTPCNWTVEEDTALLGMRGRKMAFRCISQAIGRTVAACRFRYKTLTAFDVPAAAEKSAAPVWRDFGKGAQAAYARAQDRVDLYVATGDARSAAINQVYQEMGVRVR